MSALAKHICVAFLAFLGITANAPGYEFGIDGKPLICVPKNDVPGYNRSLIHSSLSLVPGNVPIDLLTFQYNAPEMVKAIPGFRINPDYRDDDPPNVLDGEVYLVGNKYKNRSLGEAAGPDVEKIWDRSGACKEPVIAKVSDSSTYLAKCDYKDFWHILFDRRPGTKPRPSNLYDSVLAECTHTSITFGPHKGAELENCTRRIFIENFRVDYEFQIENAGVIPQMDAFIRSKINSWKLNCPREL